MITSHTRRRSPGMACTERRHSLQAAWPHRRPPDWCVSVYTRSWLKGSLCERLNCQNTQQSPAPCLCTPSVRSLPPVCHDVTHCSWMVKTGKSILFSMPACSLQFVTRCLSQKPSMPHQWQSTTVSCPPAARTAAFSTPAEAERSATSFEIADARLHGLF